ncbi:hypothetical protein [Bradyrhizobium genosp. SA-3]|uniref:hypothetical protein n=1 Tax=Bradyrhizobium genosp. SA-3 TaxID=508868 RepID=UPI001029CB2C|nr:hypothetical protein [Bradyrhizobium genosp. SA-3]
MGENELKKLLSDISDVLSVLRVRLSPHRALVNRAAQRLGLAALIPRARANHVLAGAETKNRTFMQQPPAQRSGLILACRDTERLQRTLHILWEGLAIHPGCDPEAAIDQ